MWVGSIRSIFMFKWVRWSHVYAILRVSPLKTYILVRMHNFREYVYRSIDVKICEIFQFSNYIRCSIILSYRTYHRLYHLANLSFRGQLGLKIETMSPRQPYYWNLAIYFSIQWEVLFVELLRFKVSSAVYGKL